MSNQEQSTTKEDQPPIFKTWTQLYTFVLIVHAIIIALFYFFTKIYQ